MLKQKILDYKHFFCDINEASILFYDFFLANIHDYYSDIASIKVISTLFAWSTQNLKENSIDINLENDS
jgi:hypothetical protein